MGVSLRMMLSRRLFCTCLFALGAADGLAAKAFARLAPAALPATDPLDRWLALLAEHGPAARLGQRAMNILSAKDTDALFGETTRHFAGVAPTRASLRDVVAADFRDGRTVGIDGFLFSRTEACLYVRIAQRLT